MEKKSINHTKGTFWKNDVTTLILRLLVAYLCLIILQTAFYMIDKPYLGHINGFAEAWNIAKGSFVYNIMSLLWTNCLFILLSILPFRIREKRWYQGILYAIFLVTNTAMIVLNGSDVIYFSHTMKRFTIEETHFISNSNNIPILVDFLQHNLPISIICVALIALLVYGWHYIKYQPTKIEDNKRYYLVNSITAVIIVFLCFCGMRGTFNPTNLG